MNLFITKNVYPYVCICLGIFPLAAIIFKHIFMMPAYTVGLYTANNVITKKQEEESPNDPLQEPSTD